MGLANIGGVFIVLLGGMIVSCLIAVVEYAWGKRMLLQDENVSCAQGTASRTGFLHSRNPSYITT